MNDINHMDVVPRIVDNNMKITTEQLKNEKKKNESYINKKNNYDNIKNNTFNKQQQTSINTTESSGFNITYVLIIVIIILIIGIIFILYYFYYRKDKVRDNSMVIHPIVNKENTENKEIPKYDYSKYIQPTDEIETVSFKSNNNSSKNEDDQKSELTILSNMDIDEKQSEQSDKTQEDVSDNKSLIDKLQEDLKNN